MEGLSPAAWLELGLLLLFGLLLRLVALGRSDTDQWANRAMIERQRGHRWVHYELSDSLVPGLLAYPQLVHFLASRLPPAASSAGAFAMTLLPDVLLAAAVHAVVWQRLSGGGVSGERAAGFAFAGALLFLTLPALLSVSSRMRAANGRAPGLLLATGALASSVLALTGQGVAWLLPSAALTAAVILTSQFASQVVVFFSLGLALCYGSWLPVAPVAAALLLGWLLPGLGIRDLLIMKVNHMIWYSANRERATTATGRNLLRNALELPRALLRDRPRARELLLQRSPFWIAAWSVPPLWVLGFCLLAPGALSRAASDPLLFACLAWIACGAAAFLLTSTGPLTILGEAERYFEYTAPALCVALPVLAASGGILPVEGLLALALLQGCVVAAVQLAGDPSFGHRMRFGLARSPEVEELADFLRGLPGPVRAATIPIKLPYLLSLHTGVSEGARVKYYYRNLLQPDRRIDGFRYFTEDTEELDYFRGTPKELADRYGIDTVVADRRYLAKRDTEFGRALQRMEPVFGNLKYLVYRL